MDRGRQGGFITDNNYVMVKYNEKKRKEHLRRLKKIKHRKPGSSATLDNNPPVIINAMLNNPRKLALKDSFNFVTERENKALLKRITSILVAPPAITDQQYKEMKKLVSSTTKGIGGKSLFEEKIVQKKNKEFFENLKKTKAYYNVAAWEQDYKKQLFNQRFMRQVKYKRPPNFVDPLLPPISPSSTNEKPLKNSASSPSDPTAESGLETNKDSANHSRKQSSFTSSGRHKSSAAHVDRIRSYKSSKGHTAGHSNKTKENGNSPKKRDISANNSTAEGDDEEGYDGEFYDEDSQNNNNIQIQVFQGDSEYDHDSFFNEGESSLISTESRLPLAGVERSVKVTKVILFHTSAGEPQEEAPEDVVNRIMGGDNNSHKQSEVTNNKITLDEDNNHVIFIEAKVECSLINREYLVLSVVGMDGNKLVQAEAEINRNELSMFGDFPPNTPLDPSALNDLSQQMVENVEMQVDGDGQARIVLNLLNENDDNDSKFGSINNDWDYQSNFQTQPSIASEEELQQMLLPDRNVHVLTCGVTVPVTFIVHPGMQGIGNILALIDMAKKSNRVEYVYAILKIYGTNDDQLAVKAIFVNNTKSTFKIGSRIRPAIPAGTCLSLTTPLPSIVQADPDMILSFAENLSKNIKAEHDCKSGENILVTAM